MSTAERVAQRKASRSASQRRGVLDPQGSAVRDAFESRDQSDWARMTKFGIIMDPESQKNFSTQWETAGKNIEEAKAAIEEAKVKFNQQKTTADKAWQKFESSPEVITVRVIGDGKIEQEYRIPREVAEKLYSDAFNQGEGSFVARWFGDEKNPEQFLNVDVVPQGTNSAYGKELHQTMIDTYNTVKEQFYDKVSPELKALEANFNKTMKDYSGAVSARETYNNDLVKSYKDRQQSQAASRETTTMGLFGKAGGAGEFTPSAPAATSTAPATAEPLASAVAVSSTTEQTSGVLEKK